MYSLNEQILHVWNLGSGNTGLEGTMTTTLQYFADSETMASGAESVTIAEIGTSANYAITYTSGLAGLYRLTISESTTGFEITFEDRVAAEPTVDPASYAYCSEADVCAWTGIPDYHSTSIPSEVQVLAFMRNRAAELYGLMAAGTRDYGGLGDKTPGPEGSALTVDTTSDAGRALAYVLLMANAVGAAMDALEAAARPEAPRRSERISELGTMYEGLAKSVLRCARLYGVAVARVFRAATHISHGGVAAYSPPSGLAEEFGFEPGKKW